MEQFQAFLVTLFRNFKITMSGELESEIKTHNVAIQREMTLNTTAENGSTKVGKDPLPFTLYHFVSWNSWKNHPERVIMSWNLMACASNTFQMCLSHMEWRENALLIYFGDETDF
jgi:hypothetical protein